MPLKNGKENKNPAFERGFFRSIENEKLIEKINWTEKDKLI
jgi:hypothetical protein